MTRAKEKLFIISEDEQFAARFHHQAVLEKLALLM